MAYDKIVDSLALDAGLTQIADAIREKAGISDDLEFPTAMADAIAAIESDGSSGGPLTSWGDKEVNFYDYDGTLLHSYTVAEAQALTELPPLPEQPGLICQGWNYDLDAIKSYNSAVNVGAMYITDDGTTRIHIHLEEGRTSPILGVCPNGTVTVDWGDGTTPDTLTGESTSLVKWTPRHEYAEAGDYVIRLTADGTMGFKGTHYSNEYAYILRYSSNAEPISVAYQNSVRKVEIGNGVTTIGDSAFYNCYSLTSVTIPSSITSIGAKAFNGCYSLVSVTIPSSVTIILSSALFYNCYSLASVTIPSSITSILSNAFYNCYSLASVTIPSSVTNISDSAFNGCYSLASVTIPSSVTNIGANAFYNCYSLASVTIPSGVTSILSKAFYNCYSLASVTIPSGVTTIGDSAFYNCYSLASVTIPSGVTKIGSKAFNGCYSLTSVTIPSGVTSIDANAFNSCYSLASVTIPSSVTIILSNAFNNCYSLTSVTIPSSVTSIDANAFYNCRAVRYYDFTKYTTVPTLSNANAFSNIANDCEIRVPAALYDEWIAATNWTTYASYITSV